MAPELERVDHIHVFVADRAEAEQWYARVMGLERLEALEFWAPDGGPLTVGNRSGIIHIALFERLAAKCRSTIALGTTAEGLLAWRRHLEAELGRPVEMVDHQVSWSLYIEDPDGNPYEVTTYEYEALARR